MGSISAITVGVMGSGSEEHLELATELGQLLARLGVNLLTGAGGGVMTSVSRAFLESKPPKGISIGIVPCEDIKSRTVRKPDYPNPYVELPIVTHLPYSGTRGQDDLSRNHINILSSAAIVALPGNSGTVSEVNLALKYCKPIAAFSANPSQVAKFSKRVPRLHSIGEVEGFLREVIDGLAGNAAGAGR